MDNIRFEVKNNDGVKIICEIIATYHHDENNKDYIIYTDKTFDEYNNLKIYYSLYKKINNNIKLIEIENIEDKKIALQLLEEIIKDIEKN